MKNVDDNRYILAFFYGDSALFSPVTRKNVDHCIQEALNSQHDRPMSNDELQDIEKVSILSPFLFHMVRASFQDGHGKE